jgi:hypothetical protein
MIFVKQFSIEDSSDKSIGNKLADSESKRMDKANTFRRAEDDLKAKSLSKITRFDQKTDKYINKSDKLAEKALDRDEKAKFTKWGKFKRGLHSTKINPFSYYHSKFREAVGKEGFTNGYDFKTQRKAQKAEFYRNKADWNNKRVHKWNDYRQSKGYETAKLKDRSGGNEVEDRDSETSKFKNANDKAVEDNRSRGNSKLD